MTDDSVSKAEQWAQNRAGHRKGVIAYSDLADAFQAGQRSVLAEIEEWVKEGMPSDKLIAQCDEEDAQLYRLMQVRAWLYLAHLNNVREQIEGEK